MRLVAPFCTNDIDRGSRYYSQQLDYDLESTGIMIALPMLIGVISAALGGLVADAVLSRGYAVSSVRRYVLRTQNGATSPNYFVRLLRIA